ncbi:lipopolysaccharide biosynthesis protein [Variovorax boronicumulans]|uniref:lipopolysaccharide biosynthesis protein n=1 Tax=Variovorax boronicumulans TaxID=436515 RepID=UPI0009EE356D|nr:oligosaccharide flippase family protein [Variovorax boronicumulans]
MFRSGFLRSASLLVGGTAISQGLSLLALPLLTRLYGPSDFSMLAVYASVLGIISVAACLRFEIAIPIPLKDRDAINLLTLALGSSVTISLLIALPIAIFPQKIAIFFSSPQLEAYLWLLPVGVWLSSSYSALQFWATRKKKFGLISRTRISQAIGGVGSQVALGLLGLTSLGLVLGQLINNCAGIFGLAREAYKVDRMLLRAIRKRELTRIFKEYERFPKYSTFESLANSAGIHLPIILIAGLSIAGEAGYLMLASRIMAAPLTLIGGAVSQVYLSQAPDELRNGNLGAFTAKVLSGLMKTGVGPLVFIGITSPILFPIVFGKNWQRAGEMVAWMTPWLIFQFLSSPLSMALHVTKNQRLALGVQLGGLFIRVGSVLLAAYWLKNFVFEFYAISGLVFYLAYVLVIGRTSKIRSHHFSEGLFSNLSIVAGWAVMGLAVNHLINYCMPLIFQ